MICPQCKQKYAKGPTLCWTCRVPLKNEHNVYMYLTLGLVSFIFLGLFVAMGISMVVSEQRRPVSAAKPITIPNEKPTEKPKPTVDRSAETARNNLNTFRSRIRSIDTKGDIVDSVSTGLTPDHAKITVNNVWHYQPYQVRLQMAQGLWNAWADIHSPGDPDKARIKIVDLRDNEVGGSRVWAGSLIWVSE